MPKKNKQLTRLVRAESATLNTWLRQSAKDRSNRPVKDRLEALLWSWPIRPALSKGPPVQLWKGNEHPEVLDRLDSVAETLYPETLYPDTLYSMEWRPYDTPLSMHEGNFKTMCEGIGKALRTLRGIVVPDPHDDVRWACALLEYRWGIGDRDGRQQLQEDVLAQLDERTRLRVCEIGEKARDTAYRHVRTDRCLDAQREVKAQAKAFTLWLKAAKTHAPFVEEHLASRAKLDGPPLPKDLAAFTDVFRNVVFSQKRVTQIVKAYMDNTFKDSGRDRRTEKGRPRRGAWVDPADRALKRLKISQQKRRDLLTAWGLVPLEHDDPSGTQ